MRSTALRWGASVSGLWIPAALRGQHLPGITPDEEKPAPEIEPMLPKEGLLETETWVDLGSRMIEAGLDYLPTLLLAVFVFLFFLVVSRIAVGLLDRVLQRARVDPALSQLAIPLVRYSILALGCIMAAAQAGLQVGSLLAGVGIAGLAIGLAAQDTLGSLFAGLTILWDRPFRIGDRITLNNHYGEITGIGLRSTRIRTQENLDVILPNREVILATIVNHTMSPILRLGIPLSIAYREDTRRARKVLLEAVAGHEHVAERPEPEVVVTALGDSGVEMELRAWLRDPHHERRAFFELLELAKIALDEAGIEIPFPQRTLHFAQTPVAVRTSAD